MHLQRGTLKQSNFQVPFLFIRLAVGSKDFSARVFIVMHLEVVSLRLYLNAECHKSCTRRNSFSRLPPLIRPTRTHARTLSCLTHFSIKCLLCFIVWCGGARSSRASAHFDMSLCPIRFIRHMPCQNSLNAKPDHEIKWFSLSHILFIRCKRNANRSECFIIVFFCVWNTAVVDMLGLGLGLGTFAICSMLAVLSPHKNERRLADVSENQQFQQNVDNFKYDSCPTDFSIRTQGTCEMIRLAGSTVTLCGHVCLRRPVSI